MIQQTMLDFRKYADADLFAFGQTVLTRIAETAVFEPLRDFSTTEVKPAFDAYGAAMMAAADGGRTAIAVKKARKAVLTDKLVLLAFKVQVVASDNREVLIASGFMPREARGGSRRSGPMDKVTGLTVSTGALAGTAFIVFSPVPQTRLYAVEHSTDQQTWTNSIYPSNSRMILDGLKSKTDHYVRVRALGSDLRQGPWSDPVAVYVR
jgi:hypothetical protein